MYNFNFALQPQTFVTAIIDSESTNDFAIFVNKDLQQSLYFHAFQLTFNRLH